MAWFALANGALTAQAMTRSTVEMTCPYDGVKFTFNAQNSGTSFGKQLDGMPVGAIESPWPLASCPTNGFVFVKAKYEDDELERLRPLILSAEFQAIRSEAPYYRASWIMERTGASHAEVSNLLLQATWEAGRTELGERIRANTPGISAKDARDLVRHLMAEGTTGERYTRYASELLARLAADVVDTTRSAEARVADRLLAGEMLRRLGRFDEADSHFAALAGDLAPDSQEATLAAFQRRLIAAKDRGLHLVSEALGKAQ
ncbi:hypothetical protein [Bradyrhizobium sp. 1(2017)]|uniref:hypothetical protein n=1 Tax=Bradyrhizobium sp. 1(2017) TaxID=1404888 RepID=UPI00140F3E77|nr:hypothetical protein [Bradyrhizobium sp. 1(2017)]QIO33097.1 hypothetical protein HAP40_15430 [Bradyrhizobium sp. 1(2017)]